MKNQTLKPARKWRHIAIDTAVHKKLHIYARKLGTTAKKLAEEILNNSLSVNEN